MDSSFPLKVFVTIPIQRGERGEPSAESKSSMKVKYLKPDRTGKGWYQGFLKSKTWKRKVSKLARKRGGKICVVCYTRKEVHTHHMTYKRITKERPEDLVFLCKEHHFALHERVKKKAIPMKEALTDLKVEYQRNVFQDSSARIDYAEEFRGQNEHIRSIANHIPRV